MQKGSKTPNLTKKRKSRKKKRGYSSEPRSKQQEKKKTTMKKNEAQLPWIMMTVPGKGGTRNVATSAYIRETKSFQSCQSKERAKKAFFGSSLEQS